MRRPEAGPHAAACSVCHIRVHRVTVSPARSKPTTRRRKSPRRPAEPRPSARSTAADAGLPADERKERVLHTRVPDSLDRQLRQRARNLGMSVSTVVRHVLLNTFGLVEDIVADSTNIALSIAGGGPADGAHDVTPADARGRRDAEQEASDGDGAGVLAWHEAILNRNAVCGRCNAVLEKGSRAAVGMPERRGPRAILCIACLRALTASGRGGGTRARRTQRSRKRGGSTP